MWVSVRPTSSSVIRQDVTFASGIMVHCCFGISFRDFVLYNFLSFKNLKYFKIVQGGLEKILLETIDFFVPKSNLPGTPCTVTF